MAKEEIKYATHHSIVRDKPEENNGPYLVEEAGYITAKDKIESMIEAGRRLMDYRSSYDSDDENFDEDEFSNPLRKPGIDMAEVSELANDVGARLAKQKQNKLDSEAKAKKLAAEKEELEKKEFLEYKNSLKPTEKV